MLILTARPRLGWLSPFDGRPVVFKTYSLAF